MIRSFWFLTAHSFKNRIVSRLRRLRQPRYLISFIAALAYFWFIGFRHVVRSPHNRFVLPSGDVVLDLVSCAIFFLMLLPWASPSQSAGLTFTEAEIHFLFAAPLSRRQLLLYKVFRQQPAVLTSAIVMAIFAFRRTAFAGLWLSLSVLSLYFLTVGLARARLKLAGIGFVIRFLIVAGIATTLVYLLYSQVSSVLGAAKVARPNEFFAIAAGPLRSGLFSAILFVPRFFARALVPGDWLQVLIGCGALVVLAVICFEAAARLNVAFEEASIETSRKASERTARLRDHRVGQRMTFKRFPPLFRLKGSAAPELAIVWKNLIAAMRISSPWLMILGAFLGYFIGQALFNDEPAVRLAVAMMSLFMAAAIPFLGAAVFSQDMRLDLTRIEVLKSYPMTGARLVAAEIAAPLLIVSAVEFAFLAVTMFIFGLVDLPPRLSLLARPEFIVAALLFAVPVCAAQLLVRNALPVILPGWATVSGEEARGFAVAGQKLVILLANLIVLAIALIPCAILFVPAILLSHRFFSGNAAVLAFTIAPSAALLFVEVWFGILFLGSQFEKIDITNEVDLVVA